MLANDHVAEPIGSGSLSRREVMDYGLLQIFGGRGARALMHRNAARRALRVASWIVVLASVLTADALSWMLVI